VKILYYCLFYNQIYGILDIALGAMQIYWKALEKCLHPVPSSLAYIYRQEAPIKV